MTLKSGSGIINVPTELRKNVIALWVEWDYPANENASDFRFKTTLPDIVQFDREHTNTLVHYRISSLLNEPAFTARVQVLQSDNSLRSPSIRLVGWKRNDFSWVAYNAEGRRV